MIGDDDDDDDDDNAITGSLSYSIALHTVVALLQHDTSACVCIFIMSTTEQFHSECTVYIQMLYLMCARRMIIIACISGLCGLFFFV